MKNTRKKNVQRTELVFILDASGSMCGLENDTIGGFNSMIERNLDEPGEATVSVIAFNEKSRVLLDRVDIEEVPRLTRKKYRCYGCTALLDAVGSAIKHIDLVQEVQPEGYEADNVLFVITTDGMENASKKYSYKQVKRLIEKHKEMGWEFVFIGANIDAAEEAGRIGIAREYAVNYVADTLGTQKVYKAASEVVRCKRDLGSLDGTAWREELDEDFQNRS